MMTSSDEEIALLGCQLFKHSKFYEEHFNDIAYTIPGLTSFPLFNVLEIIKWEINTHLPFQFRSASEYVDAIITQYGKYFSADDV